MSLIGFLLFFYAIYQLRRNLKWKKEFY
jgi:hypothetical protein